MSKYNLPYFLDLSNLIIEMESIFDDSIGKNYVILDANKAIGYRNKLMNTREKMITVVLSFSESIKLNISKRKQSNSKKLIDSFRTTTNYNILKHLKRKQRFKKAPKYKVLIECITQFDVKLRDYYESRSSYGIKQKFLKKTTNIKFTRGTFEMFINKLKNIKKRLDDHILFLIKTFPHIDLHKVHDVRDIKNYVNNNKLIDI